MGMHNRGAARRMLAALAAFALGIAGCVVDAVDFENTAASPAAFGSSGTITGSVYQDMNRNAAREAGEAAFSGVRLYLFDGSGAYSATTLSDADGHYTFGGLADGAYSVELDSPSWWNLRHDWVPTTNAGVFPRQALSLATAAVADFGFRPVVRSTDQSAPIDTFTGPNGLVVKSYDDVVPAQSIYDSIMTGFVGAEAQTVTVHFDYGGGTVTSTSVAEVNGHYSGYKAAVYLAYDYWLDGGDQPIAHEYGHAWSLYHAYMTQQDPTMASYLVARGLSGDARINSSYAWSTREMIAEDYRQLFGSSSAKAADQLNRDIPLASQVPGLGDFLKNTFTQQPGSPAPPPPPAVFSISGPTVSPSPIVTSGTISFGLSAPATVTLTIRATNGSIVRTLLANVSEPSGTSSVSWDRRNGKGHLVKAGSYAARVDASDGVGQTATASVVFGVN